MQTFDILPKIHHPGVNQFDRVISGTVLAFRTLKGMVQQNYNAVDGVNYSADMKRFTHRRCKKLRSCQLLDDEKE